MLTPLDIVASLTEIRVQRGDAADLRVDRTWQNGCCRAHLHNAGTFAVTVSEVVLAMGPLSLPPETPFYGEGFQMLSQTAGTVGAPQPHGKYTDREHYRLPEPEGAVVAYGLALLSPRDDSHMLLAFASCRRFSGSVRFFSDRYELVLDTEDQTLEPGATWELEECCVIAGSNREGLLAELAQRIAIHHPRLLWLGVPTGWCSWYWYGPSLSEADILANLRILATRCPELRYVQIDDGYQAAMGDWLEPGARFPSGIRAICGQIRDAGFEPAIWVAPFIAERDSHLVREHPEWLVQDGQGAPLASNAVSFGGWRHGPWYMLDGTHPGAQGYLEHVFRVMREDWGCHYFKLDANTWGALHGGVRHDRAATRIEAYRRGMAAVRRGAGPNGFLLGCNAPMWASLGEVHAMRVSEDISRTWTRITQVARQCFSRNWQHSRLWINDPDCLLLANKPGRPPLTDDEFRFHASAILATGGMVLDGDDMAALSDAAWRQLRRLLPSGRAARFASTEFAEGIIDLPDRRLLCLFNWGDSAQPARVALPERCHVTDFWSGADLGEHEGNWTAGSIPAHGALVLECVP